MALFVDSISKTDPTLKANLIANWGAAIPAAKAKAVGVPWAAQIKSATTFNDLLFNALGSKINPGVNALCEKGVNGFKADIWVRDEPVEKTKYATLVKAVLAGKSDSAKLHSAHRNVCGTDPGTFMCATQLTLARYLHFSSTSTTRPLPPGCKPSSTKPP